MVRKLFIQKYSNQTGAAALLAVLIIGSVLLLLVRSLASVATGSIENAGLITGGDIARTNAESCIEEGLARLRINNGYTPDNLAISLQSGSCLLSVNGDGADKTISTVGNYGNHYIHVSAQATATSGIVSLIDWSEGR